MAEQPGGPTMTLKDAAYALIHGGHTVRGTEARTAIKWYADLIARLPKTEDGVVVTSPYTILWRWSKHKNPQLQRTTLQRRGWGNVSDCYFRQAAAEEAKCG